MIRSWCKKCSRVSIMPAPYWVKTALYRVRELPGMPFRRSGRGQEIHK
jgi:hypothetical protein